MAELQKQLSTNYAYQAQSVFPNTNTFEYFPAILAKHGNPILGNVNLFMEFTGANIFKAAKIKSAILTIGANVFVGSEEQDIRKFSLALNPILDGHSAGSCTINNPHTAMSSVSATLQGNSFLFDLTRLGNDTKLIANGFMLHITSSAPAVGGGAQLYINSVKIEVTYETTDPIAIEPLSGYVNPKAPIVLKWSFANQATARIEFYYAGSWKIYNITTAQSYTIPANTVQSGDKSVRWQVKCTDKNGVTSGYSAQSYLTADDPPPLAPLLIRPKNMDVDSAQDLTFRWEHNSRIGSAQSKAEIEWATNNTGNTWNTVTAPGNVREYTVPGGTLPNGEIYWRARTYNTENEAGAWAASVRFYSLAPPEDPQILSITQNTSRPTINWVADVQDAFELQVKDINGTIIYQTGKVSTSEKLHKVTDFLEEGQYTVELRVFNANNLPSEWVSVPFLISTMKPPPLSISCTAAKSCIGIDLGQKINTGHRAIIYRRSKDEPWIALAKLNEGDREWPDYYVSSGKEYTYKVRHIDALEAFSDSKAAASVWSAKRLHIAIAERPNREILLRWHLDQQQYPQETLSIGAEIKHFVGREFPVAAFNGMLDKNIAMNYLIWLDDREEPMEREALMKLALERKTLLVRDVWGRKNYGVILNPTMQQNRHGTEVAFSLACVSFSEEVEV